MPRTLMIAILLSFNCSIALGQLPHNPQLGLAPGVPYDAHGIDNINLMSGNAAIIIPLVSYPQKGSLSLSFSAIANTTAFREAANCNTNSSPVNCTYTYYPRGAANGVWHSGVEIVEDQSIEVGSTYNSYHSSSNTHESLVGDPYGNAIDGLTANAAPFYYGNYSADYYSITYTAVDSSGTEHQMWVDFNDPHHLHSTDGSGLAASLTLSASQVGYDPIIYDSRGNTSKSTYDGFTYQVNGSVRTDPDGNKIIYDSTSETYTDTVGRSIPFHSLNNSQNTGVAACPSVQPDLPPSESRQWVIPGSNDQLSTFLICYTIIATHTNFLQNDGNPLMAVVGDANYGDEYDTQAIYWYNEWQGGGRVIQSITRPDGKRWGFFYDSLTPSKLISYGDLTGISFPDGGSVSYEYTNQFNPCGGSGDPQEMRRYIKARTVKDAQGNSFLWTYAIAWPLPGGINPRSSTIVTDPNNNDTSHVFEPDPATFSGCISREIEIDQYQGAASSTKVPLRQVVTEFHPSALAPINIAALNSAHDWSQWTSYSPVVNSLTKKITTYRDGIVTSIETPTYDANTVSIASMQCNQVNSSVCVSAAPPYISPPPRMASLGMSTGSTVSFLNGAGYLSNSRITSYKWQNDSSYLTANLLTTPEEIKVLDGSSNLVAKTTNSYDQAAWLPTGVSKILGHLTQTTRWNDHGADLIANTGWTSVGQIDRLVDPAGVKTQFTYDPADGGFKPHTITVGLLSSTEVHDRNTGVILSSTDPNSAVTTFTYDTSGRPWAIRLPDVVGGESVVYCYPALGKVTTSTAQSVALSLPSDSVTCPDSAGNSTKSSSIFDGLGHVVRATTDSDAQGVVSVDSTYDGLGNPITTSRPYRSGTIPEVVRTSFDALGRPTLRTLSDSPAQQVWIYNVLSTTATDEVGNVRVTSTDGEGRLSAVVEPNLASTEYEYSDLGDLTDVHQLGTAGDISRNRKFFYDSLSRMLAASNPESLSNDGTGNQDCLGNGTSWTTCYAYYVTGKLWKQTSNRSITTTYSYDDHQRVTSIVYADLSAQGGTAASYSIPSSCYRYDVTPSGVVDGYFKGRLADEWTQKGACGSDPRAAQVLTRRSVVSYDPVGRIRKSEQCVLGSCSTAPFTLSQWHDFSGNLTQWTDGLNESQSRNVFSMHFDAVGRPDLLKSVWSDVVHPEVLFSAQGYSPSGGLQDWMIGPNLKLARVYDSQLRVVSHVAVHP